MKSQSLLTLVLLFLFSITIQAQQRSKSKVYLQNQNAIQKLTSPVAHVDFFNVQKDQLGLTAADEMRLKFSHTDKRGNQHHRYQQFYNNIPVFGSNYSLHEKAGLVNSANGYYLPQIKLSTVPDLKPEHALSIAMETMKAKTYSWENNHDHNHAHGHSDKLSHQPIPELYIMDKKFPAQSESYRLVYMVELYSSDPLDGKQYFIDANNGDVILDLPLLHHQTVPAQGVTKYYGTQTIYVDSVAPGEYYLRDLERGDGIVTVNTAAQGDWTNDSSFWDFTNTDQDEVAIDAHYCATEFYDMMLERFNWNGLGNNGEELRTVVHGGDYVNAFWNGTYAAFGDGDCNNGPLTTLEVVAHEFTHGITDYTSDLIYSGESGAINESMSDVFGKALEYYITPDDFTWTIGESFHETPYARPFRSFIDPHLHGHPKMYNGENWEDGGGVHTNSSIGNHWFYILVEGKAGVNQNGDAYDVAGLGWEKALDVVFLTQTTYLGPNSTYNDYYEYASMAAAALYGEASVERAEVEEAWKAVGLPVVLPDTPSYDLAITFEETSVFTCQENTYYDFEFTITNRGTNMYQASMGAFVDVDNFSGPMISILSDIEPGESVIYNLNNYLLLDFEGFESTDFDLVFDLDEHLGNNFEFVFVENSFQGAGDLELRNFEIGVRPCKQDPSTYSFFVENESCETIAEGEDFVVSMSSTHPSFPVEETFTFNRPLAPGRIAVFYGELDIPFDEGMLLTATLEFEADPSLLNNTVEVEIPEPLIIKDNEYSTAMDDTNFDLLTIDGISNQVKDYQGESYFVATSIFQEPFASLCPNVEEQIDASPFSVSSLSFCLDHTDLHVPLLGFDLIQFRATEQIAFPELQPFSSALHLLYEHVDGSSEEKYIYNQMEGESVSHLEKLPEYFNGRVTLEFFNYTGNLYGDDWLDYDVTLLDNLDIDAVFVNTEDPASTISIQVFPNPSAGQYFVKHQEIPTKLWISSVNGSMLQEIPVAGIKQTIDLNEFANGIYVLHAVYGDRGVGSIKLIKT